MSSCPATPAYNRKPTSNCAAIRGSRPSDSSKFLDLVRSVREPLADYQEKQGLPKAEQYTFVKLITSLCQHAYQGILSIFTMLYSFLPLLDGFLYLARFVLDKLIEIGSADTRSQQLCKSGLFLGELVAVLALILLISGLIIIPVWKLFSTLLAKFWGFVYK